MISTRPMDLSPIYRNRIFRSDMAVLSHDMIAREFSDHSLKWRPGSIDASMHCMSSPRISMTMLTYGQDVEVRARPFDDFALVQMPIRGRAVIESDGHEMSVGPGEAAVIAPKQDLRLSWNKDCEQLIIRIPQELARHAAAEVRSEYSHVDIDDEIAPAYFMDRATCASWQGVVQTLLDSMSSRENAESNLGYSSWVKHVESSMALFLMTHTSRRIESASRAPQNAGAVLAEMSAALHRVPESLRAAERFVRARLWAPLALEDMASAAGMSARSFHSCCKKYTGFGPIAWLREIRLSEARRKLQQETQASVTDIALGVGFTHLGRFASYYQDRFGELPNETRAATLEHR